MADRRAVLLQEFVSAVRTLGVDQHIDVSHRTFDECAVRREGEPGAFEQRHLYAGLGQHRDRLLQPPFEYLKLEGPNQAETGDLFPLL